MAKVWMTFNGLDVVTTHFALRMGALEANPIIGSLNTLLGETGGHILKLSLAAIIAALLYKSGRIFLFKWLNLGMGIIVVFNTAVLTYCFAIR